MIPIEICHRLLSFKHGPLKTWISIITKRSLTNREKESKGKIRLIFSFKPNGQFYLFLVCVGFLFEPCFNQWSKEGKYLFERENKIATVEIGFKLNNFVLTTKKKMYVHQKMCTIHCFIKHLSISGAETFYRTLKFKNMYLK